MHAPVWFTGVMGMARWKGNAGNRGRPISIEGRAFSIEYVDGSDGSRTGS